MPTIVTESPALIICQRYRGRQCRPKRNLPFVAMTGIPYTSASNSAAEKFSIGLGSTKRSATRYHSSFTLPSTAPVNSTPWMSFSRISTSSVFLYPSQSGPSNTSRHPLWFINAHAFNNSHNPFSFPSRPRNKTVRLPVFERYLLRVSFSGRFVPNGITAILTRRFSFRASLASESAVTCTAFA